MKSCSLNFFDANFMGNLQNLASNTVKAAVLGQAKLSEVENNWAIELFKFPQKLINALEKSHPIIRFRNFSNY